MFDYSNALAQIIIIVAVIIAVILGFYLLVGFGALWALNVFGFNIPINWQTILAAVILIVIAWSVF